jgi:hypothetical protein
VFPSTASFLLGHTPDSLVKAPGQLEIYDWMPQYVRM